MNGKEKCKALKEIRRKIAENNDIYYAVEECQHKGECKGTCPKCESELRYLERELEKRVALGKAVAFAGISLGVVSTFAACTGVGTNPINQVDGNMSGPVDYAGDIQPVEPEYTLEGDVSVDMTIPEVEGNYVDPDSEGDGAENTDGTENPEGEENPEGKENTDDGTETGSNNDTLTDENTDKSDDSEETANEQLPTLTMPARNFSY